MEHMSAYGVFRVAMFVVCGFHVQRINSTEEEDGLEGGREGEQ